MKKQSPCLQNAGSKENLTSKESVTGTPEDSN